MELSDIKGVGKTRLDTLRAAGITSLRDLLFNLPTGYKDTTHPLPIASLVPGQTCAVEGVIASRPRLNRYPGGNSVTLLIEDDTGLIPCVWFNQPWMAQNLKEGQTKLFYGRVDRYKGKLQMMNPSLETEGAITPLYKTLPGIPGKVMRDIVAAALSEVDDCCPETLPKSLRMRYGLCEKNFAIRQAHFPDTYEALEAARRRLSFEQLLFYQAALSFLRDRKEDGIPLPVIPEDMKVFWRAMPFPPTGAQMRVLAEIGADMTGPYPMARLVQGDVGSGKTAIAFGALFLCVKYGYQGALMAPTEILARQHLESAKALLTPLGITCGLLVGGMKAKERKEALAAIATGAWQVVIGTHALISEGVAYQNLGLVITDEQHRFGVRQRSALLDKGIAKEGEAQPHVLVMSATPIPRTLALILFGDLDVSVVDELPPGRTPVATRIVPEGKREGMYGFLRNEIAMGRQAYIVCPLVEESEEAGDLKAAQSQYRELTAGPLSGLRVGLTYGKQPPGEKAAVLEAFSSGELQVLVATTVIEVGVNVPNATVMIIEDAHRYGLSQLHQLRGRVGRGSAESWCFLLAEPNERLRTLASTNDGFIIAKKDLELRGPGEFFGTRQHGAPALPGMSAQGDVLLLEETQKCLHDLRREASLFYEWELVKAEAQRAFADSLSKVALH